MKIQPKKRLDAEILAIASGAGKIINQRDVVKMAVKALDAGKLTRMEIDTLEHVRRSYKFSASASRLLSQIVEESPKTKTALGLMAERVKK